MAILSTGQSFASGDQVTAQKLQDIVELANFDDPADGSTIVKDVGTGKLKVPSNGIGSNELASDASTDANRAVDTNHIKDGSVTAAKLNSAAISVLMPSGTVLPYAGSALPGNPNDYLFCNGQSVLVANYGDLYSVIGYTYGGLGASFNLPDLRGRVIAGLDVSVGGVFANRLTGLTGGVAGNVLSGYGGAETHALSIPQMPAHTHPLQNGVGTKSNSFDSGTLVASDASGNTGSTGGGTAHNNVQPTIILNYIIKT